MEAKMEAAIATIDRILVAAHPAHHHDQQQNPNAYVSPQPSPDATLRHMVGVTVRPSELLTAALRPAETAPPTAEIASPTAEIASPSSASAVLASLVHVADELVHLALRQRAAAVTPAANALTLLVDAIEALGKEAPAW